MSGHPFDPGLEDLPAVLPIFPLPGALLLPRGHLPLNIFEQRYLNMVRDALAGDRLIGMVQPREDCDDFGKAAVFGIGCAGRIASFNETDDGRYLITLRGLLRFRIGDELALQDGYRRVAAGFAGFEADLQPEEIDIDREPLLQALRSFFDERELSVEWEAVESLDNENLVNTMAMLCPFDPPEKQALLEAEDLATRAQVLSAVLEMSTVEGGEGAARH